MLDNKCFKRNRLGRSDEAFMRALPAKPSGKAVFPGATRRSGPARQINTGRLTVGDPC